MTKWFVCTLDDLLKMVPRAGIEPALPSEPHFECGASTSSANGARNEAELRASNLTREEAITRALEEDKMSQTNMRTGVAMDPVDAKVENAVAAGERPSLSSFDLMLPHSKQYSVWDHIPLPLSQGLFDFTTRLKLLTWDIILPGNLHVQFMYDTRGYFYAQVYELGAIDNVTGEAIDWYGRKWLLSEHMTDAEIVRTVFKAVMTAMEHEVREQFLYKGHSVFDPHYDLEKLVELRKEKDALVHRT